MDNYSNAPQIQNMDLNQAVMEYYFDDKNAHLPALTLAPIERKQLDDLLWEFNKVTGNEFDRYKQLDPVPYVRLPVKPDYEPVSQAPFKKNPKMRKLVVDYFALDLERKGLISQSVH